MFRTRGAIQITCLTYVVFLLFLGICRQNVVRLRVTTAVLPEGMN